MKFVHVVSQHTRENLDIGKLTNLVNYELYDKVFLANIHRYTKNVFGICTDCSLFAKFFLTNSFYLYGLPVYDTLWVGYE